MAASCNDREDEALAIDTIVTGMRRVIDELPAAERKLILLQCAPSGVTSPTASKPLLAAATKRPAVTIEQPHRFPPALGARLGLNGSVDGGPSFVAARQVAVAVTDALPLLNWLPL